MKKLFLAAALTAACSLSAIANDPCHWTDGDNIVHDGRKATISERWDDGNKSTADKSSHSGANLGSDLDIVNGNISAGESNSRGSESTSGYGQTLTREACVDGDKNAEFVYYEDGWSE